MVVRFWRKNAINVLMSAFDPQRDISRMADAFASLCYQGGEGTLCVAKMLP